MTNNNNPYTPIRKETTEQISSDGTKTTTTIGYDSLGRKVLESSTIVSPDGSSSYFYRCVEADGFWHGGSDVLDKDGNVVLSFGMAREKFEG